MSYYGKTPSNARSSFPRRLSACGRSSPPPEHMGQWFGAPALRAAATSSPMSVGEVRRGQPSESRPRGRAQHASPTTGTRTSRRPGGRSSSSPSPRRTGRRVRVVESGFADAEGHPTKVRARVARGQRRRLGARTRRPGALRADRHGVTEDVFTALADPTRRRVLDLLAEHGHGTATSPGRRAAREPPGGDQAPRRPRPRRPGRLAAAGREVRFVVRPEPLLQAAAWMARLAAQWDARLDDVRALAEE